MQRRVGFNNGDISAGLAAGPPATPAQTRPMTAAAQAGGAVGAATARVLSEKAAGGGAAAPPRPAVRTAALGDGAPAVVGPGNQSLYKLVRPGPPKAAAPSGTMSSSSSDSAFEKALPIVMLVLGFLGAAACSMSIYAYKDLTATQKPDRNTKTIFYIQIGMLVLFAGFIIASLAVCVAPASKYAVDL